MADNILNQPKSSSPTLHDQLTDINKSSFARYQDLALGSDSIWYLIKFEIIMLLFSWLPGALGLVLRKIFYPRILGAVGQNVVFGQNVTLRHGLKIRIGNDVIVDDNATLDAKGEDNNGLNIGDNTIVSRNVILSCKNGDINIGASCTLGINTLVHAMQGSNVTVGDYVLVGAFCYFIGSGPYGSDLLDKPFKQQGVLPQGGIEIENNVWFGSNVQVLDGVNIGAGSIIGTSSVVNKSVESFSIMAGVPARLIRSRQD